VIKGIFIKEKEKIPLKKVKKSLKKKRL
jgi:hypothetical protein